MSAPARTAAPGAHQHGLSGHDYPGRQTPQSRLRLGAPRLPSVGKRTAAGAAAIRATMYRCHDRAGGQEGAGCGNDRIRDHLPALSLAPCAQRCRRPKPLAPRLTRSDPREAVTRRGEPQVHGGNLVRDALRPEATAAAEGCRDTTGASTPPPWRALAYLAGGGLAGDAQVSLQGNLRSPGTIQMAETRAREKARGKSFRARAPDSDEHRSSTIPACTSAESPTSTANALASASGRWSVAREAIRQPGRSPLSPAPCDTPPRVGPRGTGLFSRRCAWATNRPCDGRYPTR